MASKFWVGGNSTWDATAGSKWASTSGGAGGQPIPAAADDVFLDNGTGHGNVTISVAAVCRSLDLTGYVGTLTMSANLTLGTSTVIAGGQALKCPSSGWTFAWTAGTLAYTGSSSTIATLTFGGIFGSASMPFGVTSNGGGVQFLDSAAGFSTFNHSQGKVDFNGKNQTFSSTFQSTSGNTRNLLLGSAVITLSGTNGVSLSTNGTPSWSLASGTFKFTGTTAQAFAGGGVSTFGTVEFDLGSTNTAIATISGANTFTNLKIIGGVTGTQNQANFPSGVTQTVTGTLTITGGDSGHRCFIIASLLGGAATLALSGATLAITDADIMDITVTGLTLTGTRLGDCGGNTGITFDSPRTLFWVGGTGAASATTHWSTSSGGSSGSNPPLPQDTFTFDNNSFSAGSQTATIDVARVGSWTMGSGGSAVTNTPTIAISNTLPALNLLGSITWAGTWTFTSNSITWNLRGRSSFTINSNAKTMTTVPINVQAPGGTYTLAGNLLTTGAFTFTAGTFALSNFTMGNTGLVSSTGALTRALTMGTGNWSIAGTGSGAWTNSGSAFTVTYSTGAIAFTGASGTHAITSNGVSMPGVLVNAAGNTAQLADTYSTTQAITVTSGTFDFNGQTATVGSISMTGATTRVITFGAASVTVTGAITVSGSGFTWTAGTSTVTVNSTTGATYALSTITMNNFVITMTAAQKYSLTGAFTTANMTVNSASQGLLVLTHAVTITVTSTFTAVAASQAARLTIFGDVATGTTATISAAVVSITDVEFSDVTGAGAGTWSGTRIGSGSGNNSGITFTTAQPQFRIGAGGNWSDSTKWSQSSGGSNNGRVPLAQDNVTFDSGNSGNITADMPYLGKTLTVGGTSTISAINNLNNWVILSYCGITGDLVCTTTIPSSAGSIGFIGRVTQNVTGTGNMCGLVNWQASTVKLLANYTTGQNVCCGAPGNTGATFDMNGFNLSTSNVVLGLASSGDTFKSSGGTLTITGSGINILGTALELGGGTMTLDTVNITDSAAATKTLAVLGGSFTSGFATINTLNFTGSGAGSILAIHSQTIFSTEAADGLTISNFNISDGCAVYFHHTQTGTSIVNLTYIGTPANLVAGNNSFRSTLLHTQATVTITGTVKLRYVLSIDVVFTGASAPVTLWDGFNFGNNSGINFRNSWVTKVQAIST